MEQKKLERIASEQRCNAILPRKHGKIGGQHCSSLSTQSERFELKRSQSGVRQLSRLRGSERMELLATWRQGAVALLENTYIVTPDGKKHPLPRRDGKNGGKP